MRGVSTRFPDDLDAATLFAQSLMDTAPWNYWEKDGSPRAFTNDVLASLESVLKRKPDHLGAIHLYIHAVEASPDPGRATQYADKLAALVPGAGHLVHMPSHIYLRTGRYNDASVSNQDAIKADEAYFKGDAVAGNMAYQVGYYPHNIHFFVAAASMEGRQADALKAAEDVRAKVHAEMLRDPGMGGMVQHMHLTPLYTKVRFGMWDAVLAEPAPPADLPFMTAMWHASRGLAHAAQGQRQGGRDRARRRRRGEGRCGAEDARRVQRELRVVDRRDRAPRAVGRDRHPETPRRPGGAPFRAGRGASRTTSRTWSRPTGRFPSVSCRAPRCSSSGARRRPKTRFAAT